MTAPIQRFEHQAMATVFELMVVCDNYQLAQSAAHTIFQKVDQLENLLSRFLDASEVALISHLKPKETLRVAPELMNLLLIATEVCAATGGAFDVTVGTVMDVLRQVKHRWRALTRQEREEALAAGGMHRLIIDRDNFLISVKPDRWGRATPLELDFGAIAKGYALDLACKLLEEDWDCRDFLMHAGTSTVLARGSNGDGAAGWPVTVGGAWRERCGLESLRLCDRAVSGSGFEVKGAHIVDVRRGVAAARHAGAWACASSAVYADALSTVFMGLSWREIQATCECFQESGAMVTRYQPIWLDKVRSPVRTCGFFLLPRR